MEKFENTLAGDISDDIDVKSYWSSMVAKLDIKSIFPASSPFELRGA